MVNSVYDRDKQGERAYRPPDVDATAGQQTDSAGDPLDQVRKSESRPPASTGTTGGSINADKPSRTGTSGDFTFNAQGDNRSSGIGAAANAAGLAAGGVTGTAATFAGKAKNFFWGSKRRKQATVGGGITGTLIGGTTFILVILSGPAQLVQLSQILQRDFNGLDNASSQRANRLLGSVGAQNFSETRVGIIDRQTLRKTVTKLNNIGIEFKTSSVGQITSASIDTGKLVDSYPELRTKTTEERRAWLSERFGISADQIKGGPAGKFSVDTRDFPFKSTRLLVGDSVSLLGKGSVNTAIKNRVLTKAFGAPSIFHPIKRAEEKALKKLSAPERVAAVEEQRAKLDDPVEAKGDAAEKNIKDQANKYNSVAMQSLTLTGGVCFVKSTSKDIILVNFARVVLPAAVQATSFVAMGDQIRSNQDITLTIVGAITDSLTNDKGESIWGALALQVASGKKNPAGVDISPDYKQAFSTNTTAETMEKWANGALGGSLVADAACSPIGQGVQLAGGTAALIASALAEFGTAGGATPAVVAFWTAKQGASFAISATAMHFAQQFIVNSQAAGKLAKNAFSGPLGGNLLAYGSRAAAGIGARSQGAIALSGSEATAIAEQNQREEDQQFRSRSFLARIFDANDYRSLTGKLAQFVSPSYSTNMASAAQGFGSIGSNLLSSLASIFIPRSQAAATYDWGFPEYGIPDELLNDPELASPIGNADKVATLLGSPSGQGLIDKANACFGNKISKDSGVWDVEHTGDPNPNSKEFIEAECASLNDPNWRRVIMFVFDTTTAQGMACYLGDNESCGTLGFDSSNASSDSASTDTTVSGEPQELAKALVDSGRLSDQDGRYMAQIKAIANGDFSCNVNPDILKMLYGVVVEDKHSLQISSLNRYCTNVLTASGTSSLHYADGGGHAVDVVAFDGAAVQGTRQASTLGYLNSAVKYLPSGTGFGQVISCGSGFKIPGDDYDVPDSCNHQHIEVPPKQLK